MVIEKGLISIRTEVFEKFCTIINQSDQIRKATIRNTL